MVINSQQKENLYVTLVIIYKIVNTYLFQEDPRHLHDLDTMTTNLLFLSCHAISVNNINAQVSKVLLAKMSFYLLLVKPKPQLII
jgi:hypothetical protein